MRDGGALAAAIGVLEEIDRAHLPARLALKAWGARSRFAGAKDRALVSGLVLDALRHSRSLGWRMGEARPRALALGALAWLWTWGPERIAAAAADPARGPGALLGAEAVRLADPIPLEHAPEAVRGDVPDWVQPMMARAFGERAVEEGAALAGRAPIDLRVNTLKSDPKRVTAALGRFDPRPPGVIPEALRIAAPAAAERAAPVEATPAFEKGWFEVQDLSSQIAVVAAGALDHRQVLDYCAGGGGKTLALAAAMANAGQIFAYDPNQRRLAEVQRRARRAGVRNLQIREPPVGPAGLEGRMDLVFVDAPCTGSGAWRRRPDAKWRLSPSQLEARIALQDRILAEAAAFVRPGGRLLYATCSVFREENEDRALGFLAAHPDFRLAEPAAATQFATPEGFLRLSPLRSASDGFFVAVLERRTS